MSSLFESFLGNAAGAGANIIGDRMKADEDERKIKLQDELLMKRQMAIEALREEQTIRGEQRGIANRSTERNQVRNEEIADEPRKRQGLIDTYKAQKKAEYDPELQGMAIEADTKKATAKNQAELDFQTKNMPTLAKHKREMARAGHIDDGAGLRAIQIEAANMTLDEKKAATKLLNDYEAATDPAVKAKLRESLVLRGVIKPSGGEFDTEKVTTEKLNPDGSTSKVEHTQRRGIVGGAAKTTSGGSDVRYDAQGNAYVKGPDGRPVLRDAQPAAAKPVERQSTPTDKPAQREEPARPKTTLDEIQEKNMAALTPIVEEVRAAKASLQAVAKSGDPQATNRYAVELQRARSKLEAETRARFGNGADAILAKLG